MEIERKYLVKKMPESLEQYEMLEMYQAYLCAGPVIRVRSISRHGHTEYVLTVKGRGMVIREEHELPLSRDKFELLLGKREGRVIHKFRYLIPLQDGKTAELDVFAGELQGLCTVEVEFEDEE